MSTTLIVLHFYVLVFSNRNTGVHRRRDENSGGQITKSASLRISIGSALFAEKQTLINMCKPSRFIIPGECYLLAVSFISMAVARLVQDPSEECELDHAISLICTQFQIGFFFFLRQSTKL